MRRAASSLKARAALFGCGDTLRDALSLLTRRVAEYDKAGPFSLAIVMAVYAVRMLRDNLIEVLDSDYIRMAELKGLSRRHVLLR